MANNNGNETRLGFWERRADIKRRMAEVKRANAQRKNELKIEKKAMKAAMKINEKAAKAFLAECKKTKPKGEYKRIEAQYNREMKENKKWSKMELASKILENKYTSVDEECRVKMGFFNKRRRASALTTFMNHNAKLGEYLYSLRMANPNDRRVEQIDNWDLSSITLEGFNAPTTIEEQKNILLHAQPETAERENVENEPMREAFVLPPILDDERLETLFNEPETERDEMSIDEDEPEQEI